MSNDSYSPAGKFVCMMCGNCCRGDGYVRVSRAEVARIAAFLRMPEREFLERFCRLPEIEEHAVAGDWWLIDKPGPEKECVFLAENLCTINPVKPQRCIDFPLKWRTSDIMEYCAGMKA